MNELTNGLFSLAEHPELYRWLLTAAVGILVFLVGGGIIFLISGLANPTRRRLEQLKDRGQERSFSQRLVSSVEKLSPALLPRSQKETSKIRQKLSQAGFRSANALPLFFGVKAIFAILLPVLVFIAAPLFPQAELKQVFYVAGFFMALGLFGPNYVLAKLTSTRRDKIRRGFADMLDLMVVCVEAGLGFDIALLRVANEIKTSHPILSDELHVVSGEIRAGVERITALRNLADRTGVREILGFVALIGQSLRFGTGIAETLRIYSEDFRDKRMQAAEEFAAKVGTKMIFPLIFCFFPSFFIVAIGPLILKVLTVFGQ